MTRMYHVIHRNCARTFAQQMLEIFIQSGAHLLDATSWQERIDFMMPTLKMIEQYRKAYSNYGKNIGQAIGPDDITVIEQDFTGVVFYAEYASQADKRRDVANSPERGLATLQYTNGNVVATFPKDRPELSRDIPTHGTYEVTPVPNTTKLNYGSVDFDYLSERCKRISLSQAIELHPNMFMMGYFDKKQED